MTSFHRAIRAEVVAIIQEAADMVKDHRYPLSDLGKAAQIVADKRNKEDRNRE